MTRWILLALLPGAAFAQDPVAGAPTLALSQALETALSSNLDLATAEEAVPQAQAQRDQAWAFIQPTADLGLQYRINDREIAFDSSEFGDLSAITEPFEAIYGNLGFIYGKMAENGDLDILGDDCDTLAEINGFADCAELTDAFFNGEGLGETGDDDDSTPAEPIIVQQKAQLFLSANFSWPLSPRVIPLVSAGKQQVAAAKGQLRQAQDGVLLGTVQAYAMAYQAQEGIKLLQEQVALAEAHRKDTEVLRRTGIVTDSAVLRARVEEARIQLQLKQLEQQNRQARRALGQLMGTGVGSYGDLAALPAVSWDGPGPGAELRDQALESRPDAQIADAQLKAAKNMTVDAGLAFVPTFALSGNATWSPQAAGFDNRQYNLWLGLGLGIPIWDGGARLSTARAAASQKRQAEANIKRVQLQVATEVADAHDAWTTAQQALPVAQLERDLAAEAHRLAKVRYAAGAGRQLEVLDARASLQASELSLLQQEVAERLAAVQFLAAAGQMRTWASSVGP
jgi:outer membrane protein TolC